MDLGKFNLFTVQSHPIGNEGTSAEELTLVIPSSCFMEVQKNRCIDLSF